LFYSPFFESAGVHHIIIMVVVIIIITRSRLQQRWQRRLDVPYLDIFVIMKPGRETGEYGILATRNRWNKGGNLGVVSRFEDLTILQVIVTRFLVWEFPAKFPTGKNGNRPTGCAKTGIFKSVSHVKNSSNLHKDS
jgi:hypothetical protein